MEIVARGVDDVGYLLLEPNDGEEEVSVLNDANCREEGRMHDVGEIDSVQTDLARRRRPLLLGRRIMLNGHP